MGKKVAVIHTSFVSVDDHKRYFAELMPDVQMINIVDDSLLAEVLANGGLTKERDTARVHICQRSRGHGCGYDPQPVFVGRRGG